MRFFFDENIPPPIGRSIDKLLSPNSLTAVPLVDKFPRGIKDIDWINALRNEGEWIVISGDIRITQNRAELAAWKASGLTGFFLSKGWSNQEPWEQAWRLVKWFPSILKTVDVVGPGGTFQIGINPTGKVSPINI